MIRLQLHLTERQDKGLKAAARRLGASRAEVIRRAVDAFLAQGDAGGDSLLGLVGAAGPAARTDLSEQHDDLLYGPGEVSLPAAAEGEGPK